MKNKKIKKQDLALKFLLAFIITLFTVWQICFCVFAQPENGTEKENDLPNEETLLKMPETLRVNSTFDVVVAVNAPSVHAVNGGLLYNSDLLTLVKCEGLTENWAFSSSEEEGKITFLAVDMLLESPIEGLTDVFRVTFALNSDVPEGSVLDFVCTDINVSDGASDVTLNGCSGSLTVKRALSDRAYLENLSLGAGFSPAFDSEVTEYTLSVPYNVEKLDITYLCDEFATVEIIGNELKVGINTVTVRVFSEDKTASLDYVITVTRYQAEDYVPSNDSSLSQITLSSGMLSPAFSSDVRDYVVYITEDTQEVIISAFPSNERAEVYELKLDLQEDGPQKLICTAEDKSSTEYSFTVKVADKQTNDVSDNSDISDGEGKNDTDVHTKWLLIICAIISATTFFAGFILAFVIKSKKKISTKMKKASGITKVADGGMTDENIEHSEVKSKNDTTVPFSENDDTIIMDRADETKNN